MLAVVVPTGDRTGRWWRGGGGHGQRQATDGVNKLGDGGGGVQYSTVGGPTNLVVTVLVECSNWFLKYGPVSRAGNTILSSILNQNNDIGVSAGSIIA